MPAKAILMIRPQGFGPDSESALDNAFQTCDTEESPDDIRQRAIAEFDQVHQTLIDNGVHALVVEGHPDHPGDVFPNNWFSTFADGTMVVYPMKARSRRIERRQEVIDLLLARYPQLVDLSGWEDREMFLEGTGSLVLDHESQIAFAARSERTNETLVRNWCADFEYEPILFDTTGPGGKPVYHTNVMLSIGTGYAIVCTECIDQPAHVLSALLATDREVIEITRTQMMNFCANALELRGTERILIASKTAETSLSPSQLTTLQSLVKPVFVDIPTIEKYGGGGVRCMLAELF